MTPETLPAADAAPAPEAAAGPLSRVQRVTAVINRPAVAWGGALLIALSAFVMRLLRLGDPNSFAFDETYYAKHAYGLWNFGYARSAEEGADERILNGDTDVFTEVPEMVVHPEVGRWLIGAGEAMFGMDPTGWRVASIVAGTLMVLVLCRLATRLTGSVLLGWVAGLLLSLDGLHLVMSRLALLDIFLALFVLLGVHCVVADRQWVTARLSAPGEGFGPVLAWRPWLAAAGLWFGLAAGTKWAGLYVLALFGLWVWISTARARARRVGAAGAVRSTFTDGPLAFLHLVGIAFVVYVLSWSSWLANAEVYEEHLSHTQYTTHNGGEQWPSAVEEDASGLGEVTQSLRSLASYHRDVWVFHTEFLNDATHPYASHPAGWLLQKRPVGVAAELNIEPGTSGAGAMAGNDANCDAAEGSTCMRQVLLLGNPVIWWSGIAALLGCVGLWALRRDWRFGVPVLGLAATWLPWFQYAERTIFSFYAIVFVAFVVLAIVMALGALIGADRPRTVAVSAPMRLSGAVLTGVVLVAAVLAFGFFWPVWTNELITHDEWMNRMWFDSWI